MKRRYTSWIPGNNFVIPRTTWGISRGCYFVSRMEEDAGEKNISCVYEKRENREEDDAWSHVIGHFVFLHCWFLMCYFSSRMSFPDSVHHVFHVLFFWVFHTLFPLHFGWRDVPYLSWRKERERESSYPLSLHLHFFFMKKEVCSYTTTMSSCMKISRFFSYIIPSDMVSGPMTFPVVFVQGREKDKQVSPKNKILK